MILSDKHGYVFVQVPNTGTTAISRALVEHYAGERILNKHASYADFLKVATRKQRGYFVFAGVRNPLDLTVTHYQRLKNNHGGVYTNPHVMGTNQCPWRMVREFRWIRDNNASFPAYCRRYLKRVYHNSYLLQSDRFSYVMRYERLDEEFGEVLRKIGIARVAPLPNSNVTEGKRPFTAYYSPDLYPLAARVFGPFMRKWGYEFPPEWGELSVPVSSTVRFQVIQAIGEISASWFGLSPTSHGKIAGGARELLRKAWG